MDILETHCPVCNEIIQYKEAANQSFTVVTCHNCQNSYEIPNKIKPKEEVINWRKVRCPDCKNEMRIENLDESDLNSVTMICRGCGKSFKFTYDEPIHPKNLNKFNWGAFFLWNWWGLGNGMPQLFFIFIVLYMADFVLGLLGSIGFIIALMASIIPFVFGYYYGVKGNELSWKNKDWKSIETFETHQSNWTIAGFVLTMIAILCIVYQIIQLINLQ